MPLTLWVNLDTSFTDLILSFLISEMGIIIVPTLQDGIGGDYKKKRETQVQNNQAKATLVQDWKKTAENLHEAFYILDKIFHKSNFSPTEEGCSGRQLREK